MNGARLILHSAAFSGTVGPINAVINKFGEYDFSDHELDDPTRFFGDESKQKGDPRFDMDISFLPDKFKTPEEALDVYCEQGYKLKIQFKLYE